MLVKNIKMLTADCLDAMKNIKMFTAGCLDAGEEYTDAD
jgi:hypothetical protein